MLRDEIVSAVSAGIQISHPQRQVTVCHGAVFNSCSRNESVNRCGGPLALPIACVCALLYQLFDKSFNVNALDSPRFTVNHYCPPQGLKAAFKVSPGKTQHDLKIRFGLDDIGNVQILERITDSYLFEALHGT